MNREVIAACVSSYSDLFTRKELVEIINIMSAGGAAKLQYFVRNSRMKPIEWKDDAAMVVSETKFEDSYVELVEKTTIGSSRKMVLGAVATQTVTAKGYGKKVLGEMKICEIKIERPQNTQRNEIVLV